jgi:hypothetical protein
MKIKPNEICLLNNTLQILINNFCIDAQDNTTRTKKTKKRFLYKMRDYGPIRIKAKFVKFGGGNETLNGIEEIIGTEWLEITKNN